MRTVLTKGEAAALLWVVYGIAKAGKWTSADVDSLTIGKMIAVHAHATGTTEISATGVGMEQAAYERDRYSKRTGATAPIAAPVPVVGTAQKAGK